MRLAPVLAAVAGLCTSAATQLFGPPTEIVTGLSGRSVLGRDVNRDGHVDLIVNNGSVAAVLLGDGQGGFGAPVTTSGLLNPEMVAADVNRDGRIDLVIGSSPFWSLIALGDGSGAFQVGALPGGWNEGPDIGDVTGDGLPDVIATGQRINVYAGDGNGGFAQPTTWNPAMFFPSNVELVDVDRDGQLDIVQNGTTRVTLGGMDVGCLLNAGNGSFGPVIHSPGLSQIISLVAIRAGDFNGDGAVDVLQLGRYATDDAFLVLFAGDGTGSFAMQPILSEATSSAAFDIGDLDGDGSLDIAVVRLSEQTVRVHLNDGTGAFTFTEYAVGSQPWPIAATDVDGDGKLDLAVANNDGTLSLLINQRPTPAGIAPYGTGTPGCAGTIGLNANTPPTVGHTGFGLTCTGAPRDTLGLLLLGLREEPAPVVLGITFHLELSSLLAFRVFRTDTAGTGFAPLPIPDVAALAGRSFAAQGLWNALLQHGDTCTTAPLGQVTSRGLEITVQ